MHHESASRGHPERTQIGKQKFEDEKKLKHFRWKNQFAYDPVCSPNVSLQSQQYAFGYAWPLRKPPHYEDCTFW